MQNKWGLIDSTPFPPAAPAQMFVASAVRATLVPPSSSNSCCEAFLPHIVLHTLCTTFAQQDSSWVEENIKVA